MSQQQLLVKILPLLESLGIDYMITGSIASSLQGQPRSTHDIDLVVVLPPQAVGPMAAAFQLPDFLLQEEAVRAPPCAIAPCSIFFLWRTVTKSISGC